jgi:inhibitor of KinA sporulation pathway (predicted exonuclease)
MTIDSSVPFLLIVDLEATCDDRGAVPKHEMETIEIGAVLVQHESLAPMGEFQTFIKPVRNAVLTEFCCKLTSIRQTDVDAAPGFPEALSALTRFVGARRTLFCSWGNYDRNQLAQDAMHHGVELRFRDHLNLKAEFAQSTGSTKTLGLEGALQKVGLKFEGTAHRGIDDARNIVRLLPWVLGRRKIEPSRD